MAGLLGVSLPFDTLKRLSFTHSAIYLTLLVVWLVPGLHALEFVFGMAHGLGWIAMCVLTLAALRARVIPLRLGVAVAVIGGVGPVRRLLRVRARGAPAARTRVTAASRGMDEAAQGKRPLGRISPASCAREGRYSLISERWRSTPQCRSPCPRWASR